jgi:NAD(P)-dependent dehydrogenase (short-subunit alcohol dehydrogenase family)
MMRGRVCLVTGGSSGVGRATATGLAGLGATLLLVSRDPERGERAAEQIRRRTGNSDVHFLPCDLSLQREVRRLAREVAERHPAVNVLANCAGRLSLRREYTEEGIERTLAVDYLAHFLLTRLLLDPLRAGAPSRVITVAGGAGTLRRMRLRLDLLDSGSALAGRAAPSGTVQAQQAAGGRGGPLAGAVIAGQAALARVLFGFELARRLRSSGVTANAFYPGLVRTRLDRNLPWPLRLPVRLAWPLLQADCPTSVYLASSPSVAGISGQFFARSRPVDLRPHAEDLETARRLWEASERLTGERLTVAKEQPGRWTGTTPAW